VAKVTWPAFSSKLASAGGVVRTVTLLLEELVGLLRQLVQLTSWLILLTSSVTLLFHPHFSAEFLAIPGAGTMAVLQGIIRPRRRPDKAKGNEQGRRTATRR
jgi:hypothetical protein